MRFILDCSVAVKWFVPEPLSDISGKVLRRFEAKEIAFVAPETILAEMGHTFRKRVIEGKITAEESHAFLDEFLALEIPRLPLGPLAGHAMRLTTAHMATFYDALYIALAIREDVKVLTADERMTRAFAKLDRTLFLADFPKA